MEKPILTKDAKLLRLSHELSIVLLRQADLGKAVHDAMASDEALDLVQRISARVDEGVANNIVKAVAEVAARQLRIEFDRVATNLEDLCNANTYCVKTPRLRRKT